MLQFALKATRAFRNSQPRQQIIYAVEYGNQFESTLREMSDGSKNHPGSPSLLTHTLSLTREHPKRRKEVLPFCHVLRVASFTATPFSFCCLCVLAPLIRRIRMFSPVQTSPPSLFSKLITIDNPQTPPRIQQNPNKRRFISMQQILRTTPRTRPPCTGRMIRIIAPQRHSRSQTCIPPSSPLITQPLWIPITPRTQTAVFITPLPHQYPPKKPSTTS